jgi:hypothetical protein
MPNYVKRRTYEEHKEWHREFARTGAKSACLAFPSDADGNPLTEAHRARVAELAIDPAYDDLGVGERSWSYADPAVIRCDCCGEPVELHGFTNTCECGADYNMSGDMLAPRSQWGEETGEDLGEILRIQ